MNEKKFIEVMTSLCEKGPTQAPVLALRQNSHNELLQRTQRLMKMIGDNLSRELERNDPVVENGRTLIRLTKGSRIVFYHASGAAYFTSGIPPLEAIFHKTSDDQAYVDMIEKKATRLLLNEWLGDKEKLLFERLFKIKASAGDRKSRMVTPVVCRIVGAYRHIVYDLPVLGPASMVIKLTGEGELASLSWMVRETDGFEIDRVQVVSPDIAARSLLSQMNTLWGKEDLMNQEELKPTSFRFGYFSLPKRQPQKLLAPVYVATVEGYGEDPSARVFVIPAGQKDYLPICRIGKEADAFEKRK